MRFEEEPVERCEWQGFLFSHKTNNCLKDKTIKENGASNEFVRLALNHVSFFKNLYMIPCITSNIVYKTTYRNAVIDRKDGFCTNIT